MDLWLYVYGNGDFIYTILTSLNFFMQNAKSFFTLAALLSLILFAFESTGVMPTRGYDWMKFARVYILMSLFVLTPYPGPVTVHDVITNQDRVFNFSNNKLPIGMIFPIAVTSTIIYRVINLYQQNFEIDENLNYTYSGMNFGANFIQSLDSATSYDPNFDYNLDLYMQNCGFPLTNKAGALSELRRSNDIFATLKKYTSEARFVQQTDYGTGNTSLVVSCSKAITDIDAYYEAHKDAIMHYNAQMMGVSTSSGFDRYINSADASATSILHISQGAAAAMKQAIGMNVMMASLKNGAQSVGNGNLALAAYDAEQFQQYKTTSALSGSASARTIPILVGIGFALLFFLYPIIVFMAISMGAYRGIGVFFQILIGINIIPLIYEILNYLTTFYLEKKLGVIVQGQGYSYEISTSLYSFTDNMIVAGNYLATASPIIAYAIVTGSAYALTSVFSNINDPAKTQSAQVGDKMAAGNQNIGNASVDTYSFNNLQGNKLDDQLSMSSGAPSMKNTTPSGTHSNIGGKDYFDNARSNLLTKINYQDMASKTLTNSLNQSHQDLSSIAKVWGHNSARNNELANTVDSNDTRTLDDGTSLKTAYSNQAALGKSIQNQINAHAGINTGPIGKVFGVDAGVGWNGSKSWTEDENKQFSQDVDTYTRNAHAISNTTGERASDSFQSSDTFASQTTDAVNDMVTKEKALSDVLNNSSSVSTDYSQDYQKYLSSKGLNPLNMDASQQHEQGVAFVKSVIDQKYGLKTSLEKPSEHLTSGGSHSHTTPNSDGLRPVVSNVPNPDEAKRNNQKIIDNGKNDIEKGHQLTTPGPQSQPSNANQVGNYGTFKYDPKK